MKSLGVSLLWLILGGFLLLVTNAQNTSISILFSTSQGGIIDVTGLDSPILGTITATSGDRLLVVFQELSDPATFTINPLDPVMFEIEPPLVTSAQLTALCKPPNEWDFQEVTAIQVNERGILFILVARKPQNGIKDSLLFSVDPQGDVRVLAGMECLPPSPIAGATSLAVTDDAAFLTVQSQLGARYGDAIIRVPLLEPPSCDCATNCQNYVFTTSEQLKNILQTTSVSLAALTISPLTGNLLVADTGTPEATNSILEIDIDTGQPRVFAEGDAIRNMVQAMNLNYAGMVADQTGTIFLANRSGSPLQTPLLDMEPQVISVIPLDGAAIQAQAIVTLGQMRQVTQIPFYVPLFADNGLAMSRMNMADPSTSDGEPVLYLADRGGFIFQINLVSNAARTQ